MPVQIVFEVAILPPRCVTLLLFSTLHKCTHVCMNDGGVLIRQLSDLTEEW